MHEKTFTAIARGAVHKIGPNYEIRVSWTAIKKNGGTVILKDVPNNRFWRHEAELVDGRYRVLDVAEPTIDPVQAPIPAELELKAEPAAEPAKVIPRTTHQRSAKATAKGRKS